MDDGFVLFLFLLFFWALICGTQMFDLMRRRDDEFPGRYDKILWVVILLAVPIFGAILYWFWKPLPPEVMKASSTRERTPGETRPSHLEEPA